MVADFRSSILEDPSFAEFNRFVGVYKFGDPLALFFKAADSFVNCEIQHRKAERAIALGLPKGYSDYQESIAMLHNAQGLRRLKIAGESVKKAIEMYPNVIKKENELVSTKEMKGILNDYDGMLKNEILEMDLKREETSEIWNEYVTARKTVDTDGMGGLIKHFSSKIDQLIEARTDLSKGRKEASPLPWWKIVIIAGAIAVSIAAVAYCYKKQDCKWVWDVVKAIGGWLWNLLRSGC